MDTLWQAIAGVSIGALLIVIFYLAKNALTTSVWRGGAGLTVVVSARNAAELERTVRGLISLRREKVLDANIVIKIKGQDEEFIRMAGILAGKFDGISVR